MLISGTFTYFSNFLIRAFFNLSLVKPSAFISPTKLYWILPVAQNMKKIYDMDITEEYQSSDIVPLTLAQTINDEYDIRELYKSTADNYSTYMNKLQPYLTPYENNYNDTSLITENISQNIDAVIDNLGKFYSSIAKKDSIRQRRFLITRYNLGLSKLQTTQITSTVMKTKIIPMTKNDTMSIKSIITLPGPVVRFSNINLHKTSIYDKYNLNMKYLNYWQLLRENTNVITTFIDNLNTSINFDEHNYLKHSTQFIYQMIIMILINIRNISILLLPKPEYYLI